MTDLSTSAAADLHRLAEEYWDSWLAAHPVGATAFGVPGHDDQLDDPTPEGRAGRRRQVAHQLERARSIDATELSDDDAATQGALVGELESELAGIDADLEAWAVDPLEGPHLLALDLEAFQPSATVEQARALVARWRRLEPWLDAHTHNLRRSVADGRVAVRTPVEKTVQQLHETLARPDEELSLFSPGRADRPDWPAGELAAFRRDLAGAIARHVRPALERYLAAVEREVLPVARPDDRPGLSNVAGGGEAYRALIRVHTSLDLEPEEIHRLGLLEVERIDAELVDLGGRVLGAAGLQAVLERLRADRSLFFSTREEVFETAQRSLARAREAIPDWFGILPRAECVVIPIPAHEEKHSTLAYYRQPAVDGSRPGQYFINLYAPETRPRYEAEVLAYHEAVPGHHLQIAIGQELDGFPDFRRHLGPTAFFEGWALYTERLSDEMGLYSSDLDRIGTLSFDGWRACRLVLDTGIHALGWTRQQAIDFMTAHTALAPMNIVNEVDRYIVWPGQALAYKLGQLEILRLRDEARARQGDGFDIRAFHDAVLGQGALGLRALRDVVERRLA